MNVLTFVNNLPSDKGYTYCPIYAKNARMLSGRLATGKNPYEDSYERKFGPADVALVLERDPEKFKACGLFTGVRGNGIVILDVDRNLSEVLEKHTFSLVDAPVVTSTKKDAAKYIFRIPEELWPEVKGHGLSEQSGGNYELLWGRQGLICGEYPGHKSTQSPAGQYKFLGDLNKVPIAPDWIIAEMKASKSPSSVGFSSKDLDFSDRTEDEIIEIVRDCLSVISPQGSGSREHWVRVGMAIQSVLPNEIGLMIWSAWSAEDPDFASEWEDGNPCEGPFWSFKGGGIGLGTLIWLADREDPERTRFSDHSKKIVAAAESRQVQEFRAATLSFEETIKRARQILELDNPAEMNYKLNSLALQAGYRDQTGIERLLIDQLKHENASDLMSIEELMEIDIERDFTIPDILPSPFVVLLFGSGGDGKSMCAWALAKHIATGNPFVVRGKLMPVKKGPVLLLNGDQSLVQLKEQLEEIDYPVKSETRLMSDWSLQSYAKFIKLMNELQPRLVVIDSLIGCSGGKGFDENKSDFATPLYWLTQNNGSLFPATSIVIVHHANKQGGFRGTSAIRDGVDEVWALKKPSEQLLSTVGSHARVIEVEKSRLGRTGMSLLMKMEDDLSYSLSDFTPEINPGNTSPASVGEKILHRLRTIYPEARSKHDLVCDSLVNGKSEAIRKSLQKLKKNGLIELVEELSTGNTYKAVLHAGGVAYNVPAPPNTSTGEGSRVGKGGGKVPSRPTPS